MRSGLGLILAILCAVGSGNARADGEFTDFTHFLDRYRAVGAAARGPLVDRFVSWQRSRGGFPIVEPGGDVVFVYFGSGAEKSVRLVGDFKTRTINNVYWDEQGEPLAAEGAVFHRRMRFERDARLEYAFVVDGKLVADPRNPRRIVSGAAPGAGKEGIEVSDLPMPGYRLAANLVARPAVARGRSFTLDEPWATPRVTVYLPAGYQPTRRHPVLYVADGGEWMRLVELPVILDNLIADEVIEPTIAIFIDPAEDRSGWYTFNSGYGAYLAKVVAWVDSHYSTRADPRGRLHVGSSSGGRASLAVALERSDLFANAALLSPSLTAPPHYLEPYFSGRRRPDARLRIWLSAGTWEGYIHEDALMLERYLRGIGVEVATAYTHEGHALGAWRNLAGAMVTFFFPRRP